MTTFFISDTHFGHANVIKYSNRPFKNAEEMDEAMIKNWNSVVKSTDVVYHLGDFAFAKPKRVNEILSRLLGKKVLIRGNHDKVVRDNEVDLSCFDLVKDYHELKIQDKDASRGIQKIILCHYPMISWNAAHHGAWMLHGHCHHNLKYPFIGRIVDVGVDGWNYTPVSYEMIKEHMASIKEPQFLDHHQEK